MLFNLTSANSSAQTGLTAGALGIAGIGNIGANTAEGKNPNTPTFSAFMQQQFAFGATLNPADAENNTTDFSALFLNIPNNLIENFTAQTSTVSQKTEKNTEKNDISAFFSEIYQLFATISEDSAASRLEIPTDFELPALEKIIEIIAELFPVPASTIPPEAMPLHGMLKDFSAFTDPSPLLGQAQLGENSQSPLTPEQAAAVLTSLEKILHSYFTTQPLSIAAEENSAKAAENQPSAPENAPQQIENLLKSGYIPVATTGNTVGNNKEKNLETAAPAAFENGEEADDSDIFLAHSGKTEKNIPAQQAAVSNTKGTQPLLFTEKAPSGQPAQNQAATPQPSIATNNSAPVNAPAFSASPAASEQPSFQSLLEATQSVQAITERAELLQPLRMAQTAHGQFMQPHTLKVAEQISLQMQKAATDGTNHIRIRLQPAQLGSIEISMEISHDGHIKAVLSADKAETLEWLQRDAKSLERALQDAGLKTDSNNLSFQYKEQQNQQQAGFWHDSSKEKEQQEEYLEAEISLLTEANTPLLGNNNSLNIQV